jgi:hypothetical protein
MLIEKTNVRHHKIKRISNMLVQNGYCYINSEFYFKSEDLTDLNLLKKSFFKISESNKDNGGRSRAYKRFVLNGNEFIDKTGSYIQTKEYNKMDGGKKRNFTDINKHIVSTAFFKKLLAINTSICHETGLINFKNKVSIGVHQIRYIATSSNPAYSTPSGLHKDNENVVFIHFVNQSSSRLGGVNYIAKNDDEIIDVIDLGKPVETIILSKKHFHAVSPIGVQKGKKKAFRDVLIITFESDYDFETRLNRID